MDRVGGYLALLALEADARAYADVVTMLRGESEASFIRASRGRHGQ